MPVTGCPQGHTAPAIEEGSATLSWRRCAACGTRFDVHNLHPGPYLRPRPTRLHRRRFSRAQVIGFIIGLLIAPFLWVALFDDHDSDLTCYGTGNRGAAMYCTTNTTTP